MLNLFYFLRDKRAMVGFDDLMRHDLPSANLWVRHGAWERRVQQVNSGNIFDQSMRLGRHNTGGYIKGKKGRVSFQKGRLARGCRLSSRAYAHTHTYAQPPGQASLAFSFSLLHILYQARTHKIHM